MQVKFKGDVVFVSQDPQKIMEYLASKIQIPCIPDYLDRIPVTSAIVELLSENEDYQVPYIDFFSFLEHNRALQAFLDESLVWEKELKKLGVSCLLDTIERPEEYVSSCFWWVESVEGRMYWETLHKLWEEECNATIQ